MFTLFEPSQAQIDNFLAEQKDLPFSYKEVGASKEKIPADYPVNHRRIRLGTGVGTFIRSRKAIENWTMYRLNWTRVNPSKAPITVSEVVCIVVDHGFCWSLNPCRIIYVIEETGGKIERYGFAFGTLPGHSEEGEERFVVERHGADDSVWFELLSFARPHHVLAKIGFPFVGLFQRKFAEDSANAMLLAVSH
jgi:uncharacterized protein (UPF0548 family)